MEGALQRNWLFLCGMFSWSGTNDFHLLEAKVMSQNW